MTALARPQNGRMIGGVCAALARRFGTSATTSTEEVLKAADDLIAPAPIPDPKLRAALFAVTGKGVKLRVAAGDTPLDERAAIAARIRELHDEGMPYEDMAVITRKNNDVLLLAGYLRSIGIPEDHFAAELDALNHPAVRLFVDLVRAVADLGNDAALTRAILIPGFPAPMRERVRLLGIPREGRPSRCSRRREAPTYAPGCASWNASPSTCR